MASYWNFADPHPASAAGEPSLEELFAEPIIQLIMRSDGVQAQDMRHEFDRLLEDDDSV